MGCDDSDGPGHAPRYLDVRHDIMKMAVLLALMAFCQMSCRSSNERSPYLYIENQAKVITAIELYKGHCCVEVPPIKLLCITNQTDIDDAIRVTKINEEQYAWEKSSKSVKRGLFQQKRVVGNMGTCWNWNIKFLDHEKVTAEIGIIDIPAGDSVAESSCVLRYPTGDAVLEGDRFINFKAWCVRYGIVLFK